MVAVTEYSDNYSDPCADCLYFTMFYSHFIN